MSVPFDKARAIKILVDAETLGIVKACKRWEVTRQTVYNYRSRLGSDAQFLQALTARQQAKQKIQTIAEAGWLAARTRSLRKTLKRADALIEKETDLDKVTRYLDKVGNLDIVSGVLGVGVSNPSEDSQSAEDADEPGQSQDGRSPPLQ